MYEIETAPVATLEAPANPFDAVELAPEAVPAATSHLLANADRPTWRGERLAAENIRRELKKQFPGVKFTVNARGGSISVAWTNGPAVETVKPFTSRHEIGSFDGMQDLYEYHANPFSDTYGGTRYVFETRHATKDAKTFALLAEYPGGIAIDGETFTEYPEDRKNLTNAQDHWLNQPWRKMDFPANF